MIYLFGTGSWKNNRKALKVGFTDDLDIRKNQYKLHNPLGEFLKIREGDELDELRLHIRLNDFKVEFLDEWFYDEKEVFEIFDQSYEEINKWLWDNRLTNNLLYPSIPAIGTLKRKLLNQLKNTYGNTIQGQKNI